MSGVAGKTKDPMQKGILYEQTPMSDIRERVQLRVSGESNGYTEKKKVEKKLRASTARGKSDVKW